jgi:hypothetical protein
MFCVCSDMRLEKLLKVCFVGIGFVVIYIRCW